jgi:hypothetical protein
MSAAQLTGRPYNRVVAAIGADNIGQANGTNRKINRSAMAWAAYRSKQRFIHRISDAFGTSGDTSTTIAGTRLPGILTTSTAATFVVQAFDNDAINDIPSATSLANLNSIIAQCAAAGRLLILLTPDPRGASNQTGARLSTTRLELALTIRRAILAARNTPGVYVIDTWEALGNRAATTGDITFNGTYNGIVYTANSGRAVGILLSQLFNQLFDEQTILPASDSDLWSATNPGGFVGTNPYMSGTAGTAGTDNSGSVATGWAGIQSLMGIVMAYSKVTTTSFNGVAYTREASKDWQQIVLSGTATAATQIVLLTQNLTNLVIGDILRGMAEIEVDSVAGLSSLGLYIYDNIASGQICADMDRNPELDTFLLPQTIDGGVLLTPDSLGITNVSGKAIQLRTKPNSASAVVSATIRVRGMTGFKVTS